jgi:peptide/nickel transport system ATP-binding protein
MDSAALQFDQVVVEYRRRGLSPVRAVAGVSLEVRHGQMHALVGESGCGKSTLARAATGLIPVSSGTVRFEGREVAPLTRRARPAHLRRLQMIFQDPSASLNPRRSVGSQLDDALRLCTSGAGSWRRERVRELLDAVGLPDSASARYPREFSGGQRQRICIARALAAEPTVIVADEPISALDASAQAAIANLLVELARRLNLGLLFISHDLAIVHHIADVVTVMYLGRVVERGPTRAMWAAPLHPYTEALIAAQPAHDGAGTLPAALPGEVPNPAAPPSGCRFHPRCPYALDRCPIDDPPMVSFENGRAAACWLQEPNESIESPARKALKHGGESA